MGSPLMGILVAYIGIAVTKDQRPETTYFHGFNPDGILFNLHKCTLGKNGQRRG